MNTRHDSEYPDHGSSIATRNQQQQIRTILQDVTIGDVPVFELFRFLLAPQLFGCGKLPKNGSFFSRAQNFLWQGQFGRRAVLGVLERNFPKVHFSLDGLRYNIRPDTNLSDIDILTVGFFHRSGHELLRPALEQLKDITGRNIVVSLYDDLGFRQRHLYVGSTLETRRVTENISRNDYRKALVQSNDLLDVLKRRLVSLPDVDVNGVLERVSLRRLMRVQLVLCDLDRLLRVSNPQLVIIPDERLPEARAAACVLHQKGIPVVSVSEPGDTLRLDCADAAEMLSQDIFVFENSVAKKTFQKIGKTRVRAFQSRHLFAPQCEKTHLECERLRRELGYRPGRYGILFASQGLCQTREVVRLLRRVTQRHPEYEVCIRTHPAESATLLRALSGAQVIAARNKTLVDCLKAADVLVCHSSLVAVDAIIQGCPVILSQSCESTALLALVKLELCIVAQNDKAFLDALELSKCDDWRKMWRSRASAFMQHLSAGTSLSDGILEVWQGVLKSARRVHGESMCL